MGRKVTDLGGGVWHYEFAVPASIAFTIGDGLFLDGFESGNTSSWTGVRTN